jgi:hypothetical protein
LNEGKVEKQTRGQNGGKPRYTLASSSTPSTETK